MILLRKLLFGGCVPLLLLSLQSSPVRAQSQAFAYVVSRASASSSSLLGFAVDSSTGALSALPGSPFTTQIGGSMAVTPSGHFLYGASFNGVAAYSIDPNSGALTPVAGSPFSTGPNGATGPMYLTMDPLGRFLYLVNFQGADIFVYGIDQNTGALTLQPNSPFSTQYFYPTLLTIDGTGQFAYVIYQPNRGGPPSGAGVSAYTINPNDGSLTLVSGSPYMIPRDPSSVSPFGPSTAWAAANPNMGLLYVGDVFQSDLWTFTIDPASGGLSLTASSPMPLPHAFNQFAVASSGRFAYFSTSLPNSTDCGNFYPYTKVNAPDSVFAYSIDPKSGDLSPVANSPVQAAGYMPYGVAIDPSGRFAVVLNLQGFNYDPNSSNISAYSIDGTSGTPRQVLGSPFPSGAHAYFQQGLVIARPQ